MLPFLRVVVPLIGPGGSCRTVWSTALKIKQGKIRNCCIFIMRKRNVRRRDWCSVLRVVIRSVRLVFLYCSFCNVMPSGNELWIPVILHACCRRLAVTTWWSQALLRTDVAFVTVMAPPVRLWGERLKRVKDSVCNIKKCIALNLAGCLDDKSLNNEINQHIYYYYDVMYSV